MPFALILMFFYKFYNEYLSINPSQVYSCGNEKKFEFITYLLHCLSLGHHKFESYYQYFVHSFVFLQDRDTSLYYFLSICFCDWVIFLYSKIGSTIDTTQPNDFPYFASIVFLHFCTDVY